MVTHDVAIIGFGPAGAVAAGLLGQAGLRVHVCDRQREVYDRPRAISLDHEIMRVLQELGVAEQVGPHTEPFTPSEYYGVDGQLIKRFTAIAPPYPLGYPPSLVFNQPAVERIVRARVRALPNVDIALGTTLTGLTQTNEAAVLTLQTETGGSETITARYVIGCDGASSTVRALSGLALEDLGFDEPWLVADLLVNERGLAKLPKVSIQYCEPERPCTYVIGPRNHRRWEISINAGEDPQHLATAAGTWQALQRWLTPDDAELWRQATYRFHALVASNWRAGRFFIAGDAAHQQPPFLGQGMCQGVRDVANLAWKLSAVLAGRASEALLDTYGMERRQHVVDLTTRIKAIGAVICERNIVKARARDRQLLADCDGNVRDEPRQNVQPALQSGCLADQLHPAKGTLFPQPRIRSDETKHLLDEVTGCGWRLMLAPGVSEPDWTLPLAPRLGLTRWHCEQLHETKGVVAAWFERFQCRAALVRPDHYVFGVDADGVSLERELPRLSLYYG